MLKILYLGRLADQAGTRDFELELPEGVTDTDRLREWLGRDDPELLAELRRPSTRAVVDNVVVVDPAALAGHEEVAFMPPVSGG